MKMSLFHASVPVLRSFLTAGALLFAMGSSAQSLETFDNKEVGLSLANYRYQETSNGSFFMSNDGNKLGLHGAFTKTLAKHWFWGGDLKLSYGLVSYDSASDGRKIDNPDLLTEIRFTGGRDFSYDNYLLAPYFGLGHRVLFNDLRGTTSSGAVGYRRLSQYTYLPLGLTFRQRMGPKARLSTSLEYDWLLEGRQQSFLSDVTVGSNDPINLQNYGQGLRFSMNYETLGWTAGFYANYWGLGDSNWSQQLINGNYSGWVREPRNTTQEIGLTFRLRFR